MRINGKHLVSMYARKFEGKIGKSILMNNHKQLESLNKFIRHTSNKENGVEFERYVIYDCDMGSDDAWGLAMLLRGEERFPILAKKLKSSEKPMKDKTSPFKILGVTCVHGNTNVDNVVRNVIRLLQNAKRLDIPIFKGCPGPLIPKRLEKKYFYHGKDGFGDLKYDEDIDICLTQQEHAVSAMYRLACEHPKKVDFICVGPLTNFATCITLFGVDFLNKIGSVSIMGGTNIARGNITKSAEFNFYEDPEAAYTTLETTQSNLYTILPFEPTMDDKLEMPLKKFRFDYIGRGKNPVLPLLNRVEESILATNDELLWNCCDAELVAAYLFPNLAVEKSKVFHATVELHGTETRGQMVLDYLKNSKDNATIIYRLNGPWMRKIFAWTACTEDSDLEESLT